MCSLEIDAFFRPAAVTLAQLTAFLLLRDAGFDLRARLGALFGVGTAAYMPCSGVSGGWEARQKAVRCRMAAPVKVCGCRPHGGGAADTRGRRTQTSKGGNRGRCDEAARQTLWVFGRWRLVAEVR